MDGTHLGVRGRRRVVKRVASAVVRRSVATPRGVGFGGTLVPTRGEARAGTGAGTATGARVAHPQGPPTPSPHGTRTQHPQHCGHHERPEIPVAQEPQAKHPIRRQRVVAAPQGTALLRRGAIVTAIAVFAPQWLQQYKHNQSHHTTTTLLKISRDYNNT